MIESNVTLFKVAIVTRTRDRPVLLRRALESVLGQSFQDWLHIIVNDGGNAGIVDALTAEYMASYRGRLRIIHHSDSRGMQNASNAAIQATKSEYVTIHDDDDSWEPAFLEKSVAHLDKLGLESRVQGVVVHTHWIFEEINALGTAVELRRQNFPAADTITLADVAGENRFPPIAFLYRRRVHETLGYFNETFSVLGDWDFNLRFLCQYDLDVIPEKLANWHWRHQGSGSVYGNSVTAGVAVHKAMESRLFNHYMRQDIEKGRPGLGLLMNVSRPVALLSHKVDALRTRVEQSAATAAATLSQAEHLNRITRDLSRLWELKERVRCGLAIVRERRCRPVSSVDVSAQRNIRREMEILVAGLRSDAVLSLDVFDTALMRVLRQPTDLFALLEPAMQALPGMAGVAFAQARLAAERLARRRLVAGAREDVMLSQVYDVLAEITGIAPAVAERAMEIEIAAERHLIYANPIVLELACAARKKGVRVVFVSDMYLPENIIRDLLETNGYPSPEVFVSGVAGKTKHSGALFEEVLQKVGCTAEHLVHVGDHPVSDAQRPRKMGIRCLHVNREDYGALPWVDQHTALSGADGTDVLSSVITGLVRRRAVAAGTEDIWSRLGYELAGPMAYAFARWIAQQAGTQGVQRLFFLARDGYLLEKVFRACSEQWGLGLKSTYMYSSRRLINLARIEHLDEAAFQFMLTADPFLRVRDFLERIGLSSEALADDVLRAGFSGLDEVLTTREGFFKTPECRDAMRRLLAGQESRILDMAGQERQTLRSYFDDLGFSSPATAIVDLGWQASSIRSLQDLLCARDASSRLTGYYFGTWPSAASALNAGCRLNSFFCHLGEPKRRAGLLSECVELLEHFFTAPHPTVTGLQCVDGRWNPVCGGWETTERQRECLATVARSAMEFVDDMLKIEPKQSLHLPPFGYLDSVLERVLRHPTRTEAEVLGALPHRDSFGGAAPWRYLAKVPSTARAVLKPSSLRDAYARSYWKAGFIAQLGPTERVVAQG